MKKIHPQTDGFFSYNRLTLHKNITKRRRALREKTPKKPTEVCMRVNITAKIIAAFLFFAIVLGIFVSAESNNKNVSGDTTLAKKDAVQTMPTEEEFPDLGLTCKSAVLMEATTGKVLYAHNPDEALPPASVTKVMTLLLVMEAIDSGVLNYTDKVTASANAASMGGSQIYLKEGETMTVEDLLKSVVIASANDAAVALAEHIAGSEEAFVARMNERAAELGMISTKFENTNGLDDTTTAHLTSARDIAIMSRELIKHRKILEYSSTWMDTIRDGSFGLTNTNRLVRFYNGATGLKTGSTSRAKFCISATANRDGMELICVIMAADTRDVRNAEAKALLDWGYSNFELYKCDAASLGEIKVTGGIEDCTEAAHGEMTLVVKKGEAKRIQKIIDMPESVAAPIAKGDKIGTVRFELDGKAVGETDITTVADIEKIGFWGLFGRMIKGFFLSA